MKQLTIQPNDAGQRLDKFLIKALRLPASFLYKALRKKRIKLDGARAHGSEILREGQVLSLYLNDDLFPSPAPADRGVAGALSIVYEDPDLLILDKPAGLLSHAPAGEDSLLARARRYLIDSGAFSPDTEQTFSPALCNRLDRNTAGLLLVAKNAPALRRTNALLAERKIHKFYLCLCEGCPSPREGEWFAFYEKDEKANRALLFSSPAPGRARVGVGYRVLERREGCALCEVELFTGKSHQIRALFSRAGHPLCGDAKYGARQSGGQALVAWRLVFDFPAEEGPLAALAGREIRLSEAPRALGKKA